MNKKRTIIIIIIILLILLAGGFLVFRRVGERKKVIEEGEKSVAPKQEQESAFNQANFEKAREIAQKAAENAPTYKFDGFDLKFESSRTLSCSNCWEFTFSFSSRHPGFGDRTGQVLAQVITPHKIRVNVQDEKIVALVTDRTFDELNRIFLK